MRCGCNWIQLTEWIQRYSIDVLYSYTSEFNIEIKHIFTILICQRIKCIVANMRKRNGVYTKGKCWNSLKSNLRNSAMLPRGMKQYKNSFVDVDVKFISLHGSVCPELFIILVVK